MLYEYDTKEVITAKKILSDAFKRIVLKIEDTHVWSFHTRLHTIAINHN